MLVARGYSFACVKKRSNCTTVPRLLSMIKLGAIIDNSPSMNNRINQICKACFYHIHNIRRISKFLSKECLQTLVHAFVTSRLDYCNSLLYGLPKYQICKPQLVQNTAARLISNTGKYDRISPVLYNLHWLTLFYLIYFKILTVTFKAIHGMSPCYNTNKSKPPETSTWATLVCSTQSPNLVSNSSYFPQVALCEAPGWDVQEKL